MNQPTADCLVCGEPLPKHHLGQRYCAGECRRIRIMLYGRKLEITPENIALVTATKNCEYCGEAISGKMRRTRRYCSELCRSRAKYERSLLSGRDTNLNRPGIATRDNWICYLCGEGIDPQRKGHERGALAIDHLLPLDPGAGIPRGRNEWVNLAATHIACNAIKKNKILPVAIDKLRTNLVENGAAEIFYYSEVLDDPSIYDQDINFPGGPF